MRTTAYAFVALSLGTIASSPAAAQCHGPECEAQRPPVPYYFTEREGARGGFETPPPPQQQQNEPQQPREPAAESERQAEHVEPAAPPPRPQPVARPPQNRTASTPPRHRNNIPHDGGRPHYRVDNLPPRYDGPRSGPPRYDAPRYDTSRSEPPRRQDSRYETSRSEPPMRYDGTDRWPPGSSLSRSQSIPSAPDEAQRYSYSPDGRTRITVYSSREPYSRDRYDGLSSQQYSGSPSREYSGSPSREYSGPPPRGGQAAGPGQMVISVEEYRALQGQARELQRMLGERGGGPRPGRPGPGPYNGDPRTSYR